MEKYICYPSRYGCCWKYFLWVFAFMRIAKIMIPYPELTALQQKKIKSIFGIYDDINFPFFLLKVCSEKNKKIFNLHHNILRIRRILFPWPKKICVLMIMVGVKGSSFFAVRLFFSFFRSIFSWVCKKKKRFINLN